MAEPKSFLSRLIYELRWRKVPRVAAAYLAVAVAAIGGATAAVSALYLPDWTASFVVLVAILGFPVAIVVSWVFDLTPEGVKRTEEPEAESRLLLGQSARVTLLGVTVLITVGGGFAFWELNIAGRAAGATEVPAAVPLDPNHVAVLYLRDDSPDHSLGWLATGLTDNLNQRLGSVEQLTVVPINGVKGFRGAATPSIDSIARLVNAGSVVQGSVQGSGDRVRVNVQLVDASTGDQLFSQYFGGSLGDPFALEDSLSAEVSRFLRKRLGTSIEIRHQKRSADDPQAWERFQRAVNARDDGDALRLARDTAGAMDQYEHADSLFDVAAKLDPKWAQPTLESGWTHLAMARVQAPTLGETDTTQLREGLRDSKRVLAGYSDSAAALALRGNLEWFFSQAKGVGSTEKSRALDAALSDVRAATTADPELARAWMILSYILLGQGHFQQAKVAAQHMADADPYLANDVATLFVQARLALDLHQMDKAESLFIRGEKLFPKQTAYPAWRLLILASRPARPGAADSAWALLNKVESLMSRPPYPEGRFYVAITLARAGLVDSARAVAGRAEQIKSGNQARVQRMEAYLSLVLGDRTEALQHLRRYLELDPNSRAYNAHDWWWDPLHGDPRFEELVDTTRSAVR